MAATKKVNTATLIRGQLYTLRHPDHTPANPKDSLRFERGVPVVIAENHILVMLEDLYEETMDGEGEMYEKPIFRISRNVAAPEGGNNKGPTRLSSERKVNKAPRAPSRGRRRA